MRRRTAPVGLVASILVLAVMPSARASTRPYTDPEAGQRIVYPYVDGGRPDAAMVTFDPVVHPVLSVYDLRDDLLFRAPVRSGAFWNPRRDGDVLGDALTDDDGVIVRVCVTHRGSWTIGSRYCTKLRVVHVLRDAVVARKRLGRLFFDRTVDPGCSVYRRHLAVRIDCDRGATAVVRYDLDRPVLKSEQSFVGRASFAWKGRYWHWGQGLALRRTIRGADVIASGGFVGKLAWVRKIWTVRTEY